MNKIVKEVPDGYVLLERQNGEAVHAACMDGGRFHGWLFAKGPEEGQWVSVRKLKSWEVMQVEDQRDDNIVHETSSAASGPVVDESNAPLATVEARYRNLLELLGVQGHDGAVAEIGSLRAKLARLQAPVGESVDTPEFRKLLDSWWHDHLAGALRCASYAAIIAHINAGGMPSLRASVRTRRCIKSRPHLGHGTT